MSDETATAPPVDPWDVLADEMNADADSDAIPAAIRAERFACAAIVRAEMDKGALRGLPANSAAMLLLARVLGAIEGR